jgi:DNA polymerase
VAYDHEGLILPNGLRIRYPNLRIETRDGKTQKVYDSRKGSVSIWGGSVVENVVQALARIIVGTQMVEISEHYPVVLTVHDAAVIISPDDEVEEAVAVVSKIMSTPPDWAVGLPVACETKVGASYGDC